MERPAWKNLQTSRRLLQVPATATHFYSRKERPPLQRFLLRLSSGELSRVLRLTLSAIRKGGWRLPTPQALALILLLSNGCRNTRKGLTQSHQQEPRSPDRSPGGHPMSRARTIPETAVVRPCPQSTPAVSRVSRVRLP